MTTIEDLDYKSISDMTQDEAIEHLRQIRLSRRTPVAKKKSIRKKKAKEKALPKLTKSQAENLLKLIGEQND